MGKYKDEDTIIKALHNHYFITEVSGADWFDQIMNQVVDEIKNVPAADVVERTKVRQVLLEEFGVEETEAVDTLMERMK